MENQLIAALPVTALKIPIQGIYIGFTFNESSDQEFFDVALKTSGDINRKTQLSGHLVLLMEVE